MENNSTKSLVDKILGRFKKKEAEKGFETEHEHSQTVNNSVKMMAGIARDHLKEDPKYYDHLEKMEDKYAKNK